MEYSDHSIGVKILRIEQENGWFHFNHDERVYLMEQELLLLKRCLPDHPYIPILQIMIEYESH